MRICFIAVSLLFVSACGKDEEAPVPQASASAEQRPSSDRSAAERPSAATADAVPASAQETEEKARALLERWRVAQNEGELEAYRALYATRFDGVKRSGDRTHYLDRDAWLRDRARMFRRPMEVVVSDVEVRATSVGAVIDFEQRWSSETYRDVGPKRLVLVTEGDELRIAREEMLRSTIDGDDATVAGMPLGRFFFTVEADGVYVVLHPSVEPAWAKGPRTLQSQQEHYAVTREADRAALPAELAALAGREVRLYGASEELCRTTLGPLAVMQRVTPHFGQVQHWKGELGEPASRDEVIAAEVATMAGDSGLLVAPVSADCAGALYGQLADLPAAAPVALTPASSPDAAAALAAVRGTKRYRDIAPGAWDERIETGVAVMVGELGGQKVGAVELSAGDSCDSDPNVRMVTPIVKRGGAWVALEAPSERLHVLAMIDLDGSPALLVERDLGIGRALLRPASNRYVTASAVEFPYFDCAC